jgi:hypothetical protein
MKPGDLVVLRTSKDWSPAIVVDTDDEGYVLILHRSELLWMPAGFVQPAGEPGMVKA